MDDQEVGNRIALLPIEPSPSHGRDKHFKIIYEHKRSGHQAQVSHAKRAVNRLLFTQKDSLKKAKTNVVNALKKPISTISPSAINSALAPSNQTASRNLLAPSSENG